MGSPGNNARFSSGASQPLVPRGEGQPCSSFTHTHHAGPRRKIKSRMQEFPEAYWAFGSTQCLLVFPLLTQAEDVFFRPAPGTQRGAERGRALQATRRPLHCMSAVTKTTPILNSLLLHLLIYLGYEVNSRLKPPKSLPPSLKLEGLGKARSHPQPPFELRLRGCCQLCGTGGEQARSIQGQEACRRTGVKHQVLCSQ